jgi:ATP-dependent exoDNAse (exonuclease V) beta subunit
MLNLVSNENNFQISEAVILETQNLLDPVTLSFLRHLDAAILRNGTAINCHDDIFKYYQHLFDCQPYDYSSLVAENKQAQKKLYPIKNVPHHCKATTKDAEINITTASRLDFANIKEYDTFKQGTLIHKVLELLDFNSETIAEDLIYLAQKYHIYQKNLTGLQAFIKSEYFEIFKKANIRKEYPFALKEDNKVTNGIIDLYVETVEAIFIVDYKSDNLSVENLRTEYSKQLKSYQNIIQKTTTKEVICLLYSLQQQQFIEIK